MENRIRIAIALPYQPIEPKKQPLTTEAMSVYFFEEAQKRYRQFSVSFQKSEAHLNFFISLPDKLAGLCKLHHHLRRGQALLLESAVIDKRSCQLKQGLKRLFSEINQLNQTDKPSLLETLTTALPYYEKAYTVNSQMRIDWLFLGHICLTMGLLEKTETYYAELARTPKVDYAPSTKKLIHHFPLKIVDPWLNPAIRTAQKLTSLFQFAEELNLEQNHILRV